jgi:electron transfer flavoprotein beta subunit
MNIVVCVKQVPEIQLVKVADEKLQLPAGAGQINPFDTYALEEALRLREAQGAAISALTMGPESAQAVLREAASLGVEQLFQASDPAFEHSDTMATARILAAAIVKMGSVDLVITGKQAVDDDGAAVGAAIAGFLQWPQVMFVRKIESIGSGQAVFQRLTEDGYDVVECQLPALISVVKEINEPRLPSLKGKMQSRKAAITVWNANDLGVDISQVGAHSGTSILAHLPPPPRPPAEMLQGTPDEIAQKLFDKLRAAQVI